VLKNVIEIAYFASGIVVAIAAVYGSKQVRILKDDSRVRNERAAKEKAIEYSTRYLTQFVPLIDKFAQNVRKAGLSNYEGPIGDFTPGSISDGRRPTMLKLWALGMKENDVTWYVAWNELESIAAAFITGVADESTGFDIIGGTYWQPWNNITTCLHFLAAIAGCGGTIRVV
jgi:hypothetical protein